MSYLNPLKLELNFNNSPIYISIQFPETHRVRTTEINQLTGPLFWERATCILRIMGYGTNKNTLEAKCCFLMFKAIGIYRFLYVSVCVWRKGPISARSPNPQ
jgi:hypothetical protein